MALTILCGSLASERIARSKGSTSLGATLSKDRSRVGFRNVVSLSNLGEGQSRK
jgi:hypothetical protein